MTVLQTVDALVRECSFRVVAPGMLQSNASPCFHKPGHAKDTVPTDEPGFHGKDHRDAMTTQPRVSRDHAFARHVSSAVLALPHHHNSCECRDS